MPNYQFPRSRHPSPAFTALAFTALLVSFASVSSTDLSASAVSAASSATVPEETQHGLYSLYLDWSLDPPAGLTEGFSLDFETGTSKGVFHGLGLSSGFDTTAGWHLDSGYAVVSIGIADLRLFVGDRDLSFGPVFRLADSSVRTSESKGIEVRAGNLTAALVWPIPNAGEDGVLRALQLQTTRDRPGWDGRLRMAVVNHDSSVLSNDTSPDTVTDRTMIELGARYRRSKQRVSASMAFAGLYADDLRAGEPDRFTDGAFYGELQRRAGDWTGRMGFRANGGRFESLANRSDPAPPGYRVIETGLKRSLGNRIEIEGTGTIETSPEGLTENRFRIKIGSKDLRFFEVSSGLVLTVEEVEGDWDVSASLTRIRSQGQKSKLVISGGISPPLGLDRLRLDGENGAGTEFRLDWDISERYRINRIEIESSEIARLPGGRPLVLGAMLKARNERSDSDSPRSEVIGSLVFRFGLSETETLLVQAGNPDGGRLNSGWGKTAGLHLSYAKSF